jgi:pimeloyl-ACP methyl ester carboxylesterase
MVLRAFVSKARLALLTSLLLLPVMGCMPIGLGAAAIVRPLRPTRWVEPLTKHSKLEVEANGITLRGWLFEPERTRARGLVVYLHGKDDNLSLGARVAERFVPLGYSVLAYDQRAHGQSTGKFCTYGLREKRDLKLMLDHVGIGPVYVIGHSLGAAVALQAAEGDPRIKAVVAISSFCRLEEMIRDRAPSFAAQEELRETVAEAERLAEFRVQDAAPCAFGPRLKVPVLLVHGTADAFTSFEHSKRLMATLAPGIAKELLLIDGAGHQGVLHRPRTWDAAVQWIERHQAL